MILSKNYFFAFNLKQLLVILLNRYELKTECISESKINSVFDSEIYKQIKDKKNGEIVVPLTLSTDGVPIGKYRNNFEKKTYSFN